MEGNFKFSIEVNMGAEIWSFRKDSCICTKPRR